MKLDVVLPAGGRISGSFASEAGVEVKALIEIGGRTVLESTLDVLRATGRVERVVIIGPDEVASHPISKDVDVVLPGGNSGPENILRGLRWLREVKGGQHADRILAITTDLPFLTPESITSFLDACPDNTDVCLPVVTREAFEKRFPGSQSEFVRLRDGEWTMGCVFSLNPTAIEANLPHIERMFTVRKSQLQMVRMLGPVFIFKFITKRLTIEHIERRCCQILGCTGRSVRAAAPELAFDIDNIEEYRYAIGQSL